MEKIPNVYDLKREIIADPELQDSFKNDPIKAIQDYSKSIPNPLNWDKWIYRIVVLSLGIIIISIVIGVIMLIGSGKITEDKTVPTILTAIGSAAIGALAGLLAPSPISNATT